MSVKLLFRLSVVACAPFVEVFGWIDDVSKKFALANENIVKRERVQPHY